MAIGSHIIPRFYLEQFATPSKRRNAPGRVWVYQKDHESDERATTVQGFERGYFGFVRPDGTLDESLETRLAKVEGDCQDTLVSARSALFDLRSASRRNTLALYAAMLFCRATQRRKHNEKNWTKVRTQFDALLNDNAFIAELCRDFTNKHRAELTPERLTKVLTKVCEGLNLPSATRNSFVEELFDSAEPIKELLLKKPWQIWRAPDGVEFVTSDNPLVTFMPYENGLLNPGHGFRKDGVVAAFPLAPNACLAMGVPGSESVVLDTEAVTRVNEVVVQLCDRFVYSKTFSEDIHNLVDELGGNKKYGESAFVPLGIVVPTVKDFLRQYLGLD